MSILKIHSCIQKYASAYEELQHWQEKSEMIPIGDQKTGCIGEFYAFLYLKEIYPNSTLTYGSHSEKGWDILINTNRMTKKIQIKTVSAYSTTRVISPIHYGWNQLFIIYLSKQFIPLGFWIITDTSLVIKRTILKGRKCRKPGNLQSGSKDIPFGNNRVKELISIIDKSKDT